ncbi:MAG TPA: hypothetical protein VGK97_04035 [Spongiibacteraceae bacterium]|jgi:cycloeucalenol cycloisomerase
MAVAGYWFSKNPDKAWAEKFYLFFIPVFFAYNAAIQNLHWLDVGNFWHIVQNIGMWLPYCVLLPLWLRRNSGVRWQDSYWCKLQIWLAVYVFFATYFHTEYFFQILGIRYHFQYLSPNLFFDSYLLGPNEATALAEYKKVPIGMYFNTMAFFLIYHNGAVICMRRVRTMFANYSPPARRISWIVIVLLSALFFAWAETFCYMTGNSAGIVWYENMPAMLKVGSICYALYFIVSFPNVYRLDEDGPSWTWSRCAIEASFVSMLTLFLLDLFARLHGPIL